MQIHVKLQIWTNKFVWFKQIYIIRGDFWWVDRLNSPILWKFNNRPTKHGQMDRSCPDDSKKVWHLYVTLIVLVRSFLTLFSRGGQIPQGINPKYS